jgi:hypothetical protein
MQTAVRSAESELSAQSIACPTVQMEGDEEAGALWRTYVNEMFAMMCTDSIQFKSSKWWNNVIVSKTLRIVIHRGLFTETDTRSSYRWS